MVSKYKIEMLYKRFSVLAFSLPVMTTWNELKKTINFTDNTINFGRTPLVQAKYDAFLEKMKREEIEVKDHILENEMRINGTSQFGRETQFTLTKNKFPYSFGGHEHWVFWIHPDCPSDVKSKCFTKRGLRSTICELIRENNLPLSDDMILFRNCLANKSVPAIEHFHVFFYKSRL